MKRYNTASRISSIAAMGAVLATTVTIGVAVLLPAHLATTDASIVAAKPAASEVAIIPSIEVIGYRTQRANATPTDNAPEAGVPTKS